MGKEVVVVFYTSIRVGRYLSAEEANALNEGKIPWADVDKVERPSGLVHYFAKDNCPTKHDGRGIARSIQATTCKGCLLKRAEKLQGWRWTTPHNAEEVSFLKSALGDAVADFADLGPQEVPEFLRSALEAAPVGVSKAVLATSKD